MFWNKKNKIKCPACTEEIQVSKFAKNVYCIKCKAEIRIEKPNSIVQEVFTLFAKITTWFKTNWQKVVTKVENIIISESVIYESRCWNCKRPIRSVKTESKIYKWLGNKWLGNKKCPNKDCYYFICHKCGKCLCDGPYNYMKGQKPKYKIQKIWVKTEGAD